MRGKLYPLVAPEPTDRKGDVRVVDEEGESYVYDGRRFRRIALPASVQLALA